MGRWGESRSPISYLGRSWFVPCRSYRAWPKLRNIVTTTLPHLRSFQKAIWGAFPPKTVCWPPSRVQALGALARGIDLS
jgi:hypothetical protein